MTTKILLFAALTGAIAVAVAAKHSDAKPGPRPARVAISVIEKGFDPNAITVQKGVPTTLVFTRKTDKTCAKQVVLHLTKTQTIKKDLPLDKPVEIAATFPEAGRLDYACGMNMITAVITVR